jgi:hypothetical protein
MRATTLSNLASLPGNTNQISFVARCRRWFSLIEVGLCSRRNTASWLGVSVPGTKWVLIFRASIIGPFGVITQQPQLP